MRAPLNRRVFVVGYGAATPLGSTFKTSFDNAVQGKSGFNKISRFELATQSYIVGEIPDWDPYDYDFITEKEVYNWNADFVLLTLAVIDQAIKHASFEINKETGPRTACLVGSALNGSDAYKIAVENLTHHGHLKVSPYLLPNLCANLPSGKAGMQFGFTGPVFSPQGACASGNHAIGLGSRMIRDGDSDFVIAGGVDTCILPEIIHGFENMNATFKVKENDRAFLDPGQASRPFSVDRKGFVLSEGAGALILAAEDMVKAHGLKPLAEVSGVGWTSDAFHITSPNKKTIIQAIEMAIDDAEINKSDIEYINAHGTSTPKGDQVEVSCLKDVFQDELENIPISSNKSQIGHTIGAASAIEAALSIEAMQQGVILPTINHVADSAFTGLDFVPNETRKKQYDIFLSNAFGFGGTNCCIVFKGV